MSVNVELAGYKRRFPLAIVTTTWSGYRVNIRTFSGTYEGFNAVEILAWRKAIAQILKNEYDE